MARASCMAASLAPMQGRDSGNAQSRSQIRGKTNRGLITCEAARHLCLCGWTSMQTCIEKCVIYGGNVMYVDERLSCRARKFAASLMRRIVP
jgi:hypothetical protein